MGACSEVYLFICVLIWSSVHEGMHAYACQCVGVSRHTCMCTYEHMCRLMDKRSCGVVAEWLSACVMCICVCGHEQMCIHMYLGGLDCMCVWAEMHAGVHACQYMGSYLLTNMCLPTQKAG